MTASEEYEEDPLVNIEKSFAELLKWFRRHSGLTQKQLAEKLDVRRSTITDWENSQFAPKYRDHVKKLAEIFNLSPVETNQLLQSAHFPEVPPPRTFELHNPDMSPLIGNPIGYYTCFISYSSNDQAFAERLYSDLQANNVRCWYAPEDLKIGDKFRVRIDESIQLYDKLLLILSEASLASNWVAYEVEKALNKEPEGTPNVLFPIRLDMTILTCEADWAKDIRKSRHIGDFEHWKDHGAYQQAFQRLLRDLKAQS